MISSRKEALKNSWGRFLTRATKRRSSWTPCSNSKVCAEISTQGSNSFLPIWSNSWTPCQMKDLKCCEWNGSISTLKTLELNPWKKSSLGWESTPRESALRSLRTSHLRAQKCITTSWMSLPSGRLRFNKGKRSRLLKITMITFQTRRQDPRDLPGNAPTVLPTRVLTEAHPNWHWTLCKQLHTQVWPESAAEQGFLPPEVNTPLAPVVTWTTPTKLSIRRSKTLSLWTFLSTWQTTCAKCWKAGRVSKHRISSSFSCSWPPRICRTTQKTSSRS